MSHIFKNSTSRAAVSALCAFSVLVASAGVASAGEAWPARPIRMIVGFAPGGPTDSAARFVAEGVGKKLGTSVVIENKPGANGQNAISELKRAKPDGYTLLFITSGSLSVAPARYRNLPYNVEKDFEYIGAVASYPSILVTNKGSSFNTLPELISQSRQAKDGLSAGTVSNTQELTLALFKKKLGVVATGVPYRGDAHAINDIGGGSLDFAFISPSVAVPMIESGRIKAIGVTGVLTGAYANKLQKIDGLDVKAWSGIVALTGTDAAVSRKLGDAMEAVLKSSEFKQSLEASGQSVLPLKNQAFREFVVEEKRMWEKTAVEAGLEKL